MNPEAYRRRYGVTGDLRDGFERLTDDSGRWELASVEFVGDEVGLIAHFEPTGTTDPLTSECLDVRLMDGEARQMNAAGEWGYEDEPAAPTLAAAVVCIGMVEGIHGADAYPQEVGR